MTKARKAKSADGGAESAPLLFQDSPETGLMRVRAPGSNQEEGESHTVIYKELPKKIKSRVRTEMDKWEGAVKLKGKTPTCERVRKVNRAQEIISTTYTLTYTFGGWIDKRTMGQCHFYVKIKVAGENGPILKSKSWEDEYSSS